MAERIELSEELRHYLLEPENLPSTITVCGRKYTPVAPTAAGYKGVVWQAKDEFGRDRALKLCVYGDYEERSYLQEVARAARLEPYQEFARFIDAGIIEHSVGENDKHKFVCLVEEWIDGLTLREFVKENWDLVTASFLLSYVKSLSGALAALQEVELRHDDLHDENVMLARPVNRGLTAEWKVKVIDTGSMKPIAAPTTKPKDDHQHFVDHIVLLWNTAYSRGKLPVRDRRFLVEAQQLLQLMLDEDPTIAPFNLPHLYR